MCFLCLKAVRPFLAFGADLDWEALLEANGDFLGSRGGSDRIIGACNGQKPSAPCTKKARVLTEGSPKVVEEISGHVAAVRNVVIHAV